MDTLTQVGFVVWVFVLSIYLSACVAASSDWYTKAMPLWAYPGLALFGVMCVALTGFLLYTLALPVIHIFGG
jgi:hypothetical protein